MLHPRPIEPADKALLAAGLRRLSAPDDPAALPLEQAELHGRRAALPDRGRRARPHRARRAPADDTGCAGRRRPLRPPRRTARHRRDGDRRRRRVQGRGSADAAGRGAVRRGAGRPGIRRFEALMQAGNAPAVPSSGASPRGCARRTCTRACSRCRRSGRLTDTLRGGRRAAPSCRATRSASPFPP